MLTELPMAPIQLKRLVSNGTSCGSSIWRCAMLWLNMPSTVPSLGAIS